MPDINLSLGVFIRIPAVSLRGYFVLKIFVTTRGHSENDIKVRADNHITISLSEIIFSI